MHCSKYHFQIFSRFTSLSVSLRKFLHVYTKINKSCCPGNCDVISVALQRKMKAAVFARFSGLKADMTDITGAEVCQAGIRANTQGKEEFRRLIKGNREKELIRDG